MYHIGVDEEGNDILDGPLEFEESEDDIWT